MVTQKPFSTISYNSEPFLKLVLDRLCVAGVLSNYRYIVHKGEDGDKNHIHLYLEPARRVQTDDILKQLEEYEKGSLKPLKCLSARSSKEEDWLMYAIHDSSYLEEHNSLGDGKIPYSVDDIKFYNDSPERLKNLVSACSTGLRGKSVKGILNNIDNGALPTDLLRDGANPFKVSQVLNVVRSETYGYRSSKMLSEVLDALDKLLDLQYDFDCHRFVDMTSGEVFTRDLPFE